MRTLLGLIGIAALVVVGLMMAGLINIDTKPGSLPSMRVEGGQAPKVDVDVGKIDVGTVNRTVEVPKISVERAGNSQ